MGAAVARYRATVDDWAIADLITPMAIRVAATLRVADHLGSGHTVDAIASQENVDAAGATGTVFVIEKIGPGRHVGQHVDGSADARLPRRPGTRCPAIADLAAGTGRSSGPCIQPNDLAIIELAVSGGGRTSGER